MQNKAKWHKPKITVLIRDKRPERVLSFCKSSVSGAMPLRNFSGCNDVGMPTGCAACISQQAS